MNLDALIKEGTLRRTTIDQYSFSWRLLSLKEYRIFAGLRNTGIWHPWIVYNHVFARCVDAAFELIDDEMPAGIAISIGELIMWVSGDCDGTTFKEDLALIRSAYPAESTLEHMKHVIHIAFPAYKIEELEAWDRVTLIQNFNFAEAVLTKRSGTEGYQYNPLDLKELKTAAEREAEKKKKNGSGIDFGKENAALEKAIDSSEHPLDRAPEDLMKTRRRSISEERTKNKFKLSSEQAQSLDRQKAIQSRAEQARVRVNNKQRGK